MPATDIETRTIVAQPVGYTDTAGPGPGRVGGYAYVFQSPSHDLGGFIEHIAPGAGAQALAAGDIVGLIDHDESKVIGRKSKGTLRVAEDSVGAHYEIDLPDTTVGRDLAENLRRGDINGSSFAFQVAPDSDHWTEIDGQLLRTITRMSFIRDVSPVTVPAYPATEAALRSLSQAVRLPEVHLRRAADRDNRDPKDVGPAPLGILM